MKIPAHGKSKDQIKTELEAFAGRDLSWRDGKTLAYIYDGGADVEEIAKWAYMRYLTENGLDPTVYPSMMLIENELSAMAAMSAPAPSRASINARMIITPVISPCAPAAGCSETPGRPVISVGPLKP